MKLILYSIFGEKFITFLLVILILEGILLTGVGIVFLIRVIQEEFQQPKPHPKK